MRAAATAMTSDNTLATSGGVRTGTQPLAATADLGLAHGLWLLVVQAVLVCVLIAGSYLAYPWLRAAFDKPIRKVVISGEFRALDRQAIEGAVVIYETDTFLGIDLPALVEQLEEQPWIARARARRQWPDTVAIDIVEEVPIAYWGDRWMVNAKGRLFEHQGLFQNQPLPRLWSQAVLPAEAMSVYQIFEKQLSGVGLRLRGISQNLQGDWTLMLDNGLCVLLDRNDPAGNIRHFVTVYREVVMPAEQQAVVVDMRYRHGAAIRWQPQAAELEPQKDTGGTRHERG